MKLIITILILIGVALYNHPVENNESTEAHIAHVAVNEDFSVGDNYLLDINNDGTADFSFTVATVYETGTIQNKYLIHALQSNQLLKAGNHAAIMEDGEPIGAETESGMEWNKGAGQIIEQSISDSGTQWNGIWSGGRPQFVGIQLMNNGKAYYGWVQISVNPDTEKAVALSYAINRSSNQAIVAGF